MDALAPIRRLRPVARPRSWARLVVALLVLAAAPLARGEAPGPTEPVDPEAATVPGTARTGDTPAEIAAQLDAELVLRGMTFVGDRGKRGEFVLHARQARFVPDTHTAHLDDVRVTATDADERRNFDVRCNQGDLDVETNDFLAEGDVRGTTGDGRRYEAPWVRYDHDQDLLYSDAPVLMEDETGTFAGDGFRYYVEQRRFRLTGNVRMVQSQ
jgi:LPS export ABC transporter protein LptC